MDLLKKLLTVVGLLWISAGFAQTLPVPLDIQATINKCTRTATGNPGKNYWQNRADYSINVNFDPQSRLLDGTVAIDYTNNSPDTLKQIWFKLYPNLYKEGVIRGMPVLPEDITNGVKIKTLSINQRLQDS